MSANENQSQTRERLLEAAGEIISEVGYEHATVRQVCQKAGANVAAVNYHFRDKLGLYREVFKYSQHYALKKYPPELGLDAGATPRQRLEAFIRSFLLRVRDKGHSAWHGKLILREMIEPTPLLDQIVHDHIRPLYQLLSQIVGSIIGRPASVSLVQACVASIIGQCLLYHVSRPVIERLLPEGSESADFIDRTARHIADFSYEAIHSLSRKIEEHK